MAVAGIVLTVTLGHQAEVVEAVKKLPGVAEVQAVEEIKVAAVVESPSDRLPSLYPLPERRRPVISRAGGEIWYHISFAPRSSRFESARVHNLTGR